MTVDNLIDHYGQEQIISALSPFFSQERQARIEEVLATRLDSVQVAVENPVDVHNAMAIVRSAEAFGSSHMHAVGWPHKRRVGKSVMRGSQCWGEILRYETLPEFLASNKEFAVAGACVEQGVALHELPVEKPLILLFGNEHEGLTDEAKKSCDVCFTIPMQGMVESFNLSVAAAIALYEVTRRRREFLEAEGDLSLEELNRRRATYWLRSYGIDRSKLILERYMANL